MIPSAWTAVHRDDDNELLGYLALIADDGTHVVPTTVFGYHLADPSHVSDAVEVLESTGLSYLADRWELTIDSHPEPITVQIVEASPDHVTVQSIDYGYASGYGTRFTLETPTDDCLQRR